MTPQYNECDPDFGDTAIQARSKKPRNLIAALLDEMEEGVLDWAPRIPPNQWLQCLDR